ncbi:MAG TPA: hypothetical protein VLO07_06215 [Thermoanaerobaculia bacterium]|nr:hypothetical protein [Thermoanaerobaculia bacterium]
MNRRSRVVYALAVLGAILPCTVSGRQSALPPAVSTSPPVALGAPPLRLTDPPSLSISRLPAENPFGLAPDVPAAPLAKLPFAALVVSAPFFATTRVDVAGRVMQSRRVRDPIPSLAADSKRSLDRWVFDPARKNGQVVETWASLRLDLQVVIRAPRIEQMNMTPVTPATSIPVPFEWGSDTGWYESLKVSPPSDGTVPIEQVDMPPNPKKTRWDADSYQGPFSCRFWIKVTALGRVEKSIPIQVSDPILIAYMRRSLSSWQLRPAQVKGQAVDSWNELSLSGQLGYSTEIKQIANLRKTLTVP